jgi:hypothetical protein
MFTAGGTTEAVARYAAKGARDAGLGQESPGGAVWNQGVTWPLSKRALTAAALTWTVVAARYTDAHKYWDIQRPWRTLQRAAAGFSLRRAGTAS